MFGISGKQWSKSGVSFDGPSMEAVKLAATTRRCHDSVCPAIIEWPQRSLLAFHYNQC